MAKESDLSKVAKVLILIDGILLLIGAVFSLLNELSIYTSGSPIPDVPGNNGFGNSLLPDLAAIVNIIIVGVVAILYIMHFTGKFTLGSSLINGILFLVLSLIFGGLLTLIGSILYIIDAFS